jgi:methyl-accepting chemotaxis protein
MAIHTFDLVNQASVLAYQSSDLADNNSDLTNKNSDLADNTSDFANQTSDFTDHTSDLADHTSELTDKTRVGNFRQKNNSAEDRIDGTNSYFRRNSGCSAERKISEFRSGPFRGRENNLEFRSVELI